MAEIKATKDIASKWARVTPQRADDYRQGVMNPRVSWSEATAASADRYKAGIQEAIQQDRFAKGVKKAGDTRWQERAVNIGPSRFSEGVATSEARYEEGFAPYAEVIAATKLPPRYAKGDPRNLDRVKVMSQALRKKKVGGT